MGRRISKSKFLETVRHAVRSYDLYYTSLVDTVDYICGLSYLYENQEKPKKPKN